MSEYKPEDLERMSGTLRDLVYKLGTARNPRFNFVNRDAMLERANMLRDGAQAMRDLEAARARVKELEQHLENMCKCADEVGVNHFDTDTMDEDVERMQTCTLAARAALQVKL